MITKGGHGGLTGLVVFNHVDGCFETLLVHRRGEGGRVIEANEDTDIEEILFGDSKVVHDTPFGDVVEGRFGCQEVNGDYELVNTGVEEGVGWTVDCVDIGFRMTL